jgi:hypothetical protein
MQGGKLPQPVVKSLPQPGKGVSQVSEKSPPAVHPTAIFLYASPQKHPRITLGLKSQLFITVGKVQPTDTKTSIISAFQAEQKLYYA